jgi:hypothetical protein
MKIETYEPINTLKPVAENIWIVDGPIIRFKKMPFPTRMTVIQLQSGDLFVHSPIALVDSLKSQIDALGQVRHLISPNKIHYWWVGEWGEAYPNAHKWASPGARLSAKKQDWEFDYDLGEAPDESWQNDIDQLMVHGGRFMDETVFFHKPSRTLILADLIENFELHKIRSRILRYLVSWAGNADPDGKLPIDLRLGYWGRHAQIGEAVNTMLAWQPERVIIAHGRWYKANGVAELRRAFRWVSGISVGT